MKKNDTITVNIHDLAFGGDGVARCEDGRVIFVPQTAIGDKVKVVVTSVSSKFIRGKIAEVITPGKGRIAPQCKLYWKCGGCCYQHLDYATQIESKEKQLKTLFQRIAKVQEVPEIEVFSSPKQFGYRNKLRVSLGSDRQGKWGYGFYMDDNKTIVPVFQCLLANDKINEHLAEQLNSETAKNNLRSKKLPSLTIRSGYQDKIASFWGKGRDLIKTIPEKIGNLTVEVPAQSFWQVNPEVADLLITKTLSWISTQPIPIFIDAYAGIGTFSLALGNKADHHILIEIDEAAAKMAKNLRQDWSVKTEVFAGATEAVLPKVLKTLGDKAAESIVLLDPPRTGCDKQLIEILRQSKVHKILYVSCHPATLSRDLQNLGVSEGKWKIEKAAMFDMFPQTSHFETALLLSR